MVSRTLLNNVSTTGAGSAQQGYGPKMSFQLVGKVASGVGAAIAQIEASNDGANWKSIGVLSLTLGTTDTSDVLGLDAAYEYIRGNLTSVSGTTPTISLFARI